MIEDSKGLAADGVKSFGGQNSTWQAAEDFGTRVVRKLEDEGATLREAGFRRQASDNMKGVSKTGFRGDKELWRVGRVVVRQRRVVRPANQSLESSENRVGKISDVLA